MWISANLGKGVIMGVLDNGITPGHPSFEDAGLSVPPAKGKGSCALKSGCNNKIIGAQNFITRCSVFGMAPLAHLAIYQVCDSARCSLAAVLAGMDAGIKDGVDMLSLSLGGLSIPLDIDPIAIGGFAAVEKGIFVSCATGNSGPDPSFISNEAPWVLTVVASSIDRSLRASITLGNGKKINGESMDQSSKFPESFLHLFYGSSCSSLSASDVKDKVVVCELLESGSPEEIVSTVSNAGGIVIFMNIASRGNTIVVQSFNFPTAILSNNDGCIIQSYATSSLDPTTTISFDGAVLEIYPAPAVASFSSRGPA
ncbi:subtilisin-like protease SBT1.4 [Canna indica]|uniref:Subtilisin-like protease SBT1.4 n=1 Tax=Canna indica TaxID=4628 RepID=A0AAQ3KKE1_9LILI|nr:subtilisin-like protease SBT1.4 [Canna indica]